MTEVCPARALATWKAPTGGAGSKASSLVRAGGPATAVIDADIRWELSTCWITS